MRRFEPHIATTTSTHKRTQLTPKSVPLHTAPSPPFSRPDPPPDHPSLTRNSRTPLTSFLCPGNNRYGLLFATQAWLTALLMFPLCFLSAVVSPIFDWRRMRPPTLVALLWGRLALWNMGVRPKVEGAELLPPKDEAVVFVANHASYLDIPVTNFLPRMCKVSFTGLCHLFVHCEVLNKRRPLMFLENECL